MRTYADSATPAFLVAAIALAFGACAAPFPTGNDIEESIKKLCERPEPVASVTLQPRHLSLRVGDVAQVSGAVTNARGERFMCGWPESWSSSDSSVAAVSGTGAVRALKAGTATIRLEAGWMRD